MADQRRRDRQSGSTTEFNGGERYGESGVYYHRMRGAVTGFKAGDSVKVWFDGGRQELGPVHVHRVRAAAAATRCSCSQRRGLHAASSPNAAPVAGPTYLATYTDALADAGIPADVYDIDANGRNLADLLGVLGHYKAVDLVHGRSTTTSATRARRPASRRCSTTR